MNIALDTNVMAYAEGVDDAFRQERALTLVAGLHPEETFLPAQTLGELFNVLVRRGRRSGEEARMAIMKWRDDFPVVDTTATVMLAAADLASRHRLSIWDAVILAAAARAGCRLLLSEDLQDGFTWNGVTVTNPFASPPHPFLRAMLDGAGD